jgi:hypothetical protein
MKTAAQVAIMQAQEEARRAERAHAIFRSASMDLFEYLRLEETAESLPEEDRKQYVDACERLMSDRSTDFDELKVFPTRFSSSFELTGEIF